MTTVVLRRSYSRWRATDMGDDNFKVHGELKIDNSDCIFVINKNGYIGESTRSEIEYAEKIGKPVYYAFS